MGYFFIKKFGRLRKKYYLCSVIKNNTFNN